MMSNSFQVMPQKGDELAKLMGWTQSGDPPPPPSTLITHIPKPYSQPEITRDPHEEDKEGNAHHILAPGMAMRN